MDCLEFRNQYLAFADQTLPPEAQSAAELASRRCASMCARHDLAMRRGLLVLRNLPSIEPSSDFYVRLTTTLHRMDREEAHASCYRGPGLRSFAAAAAGVVGIGFLAAVLFNWTAQARNLALAPVVARTPAVVPYPVTKLQLRRERQRRPSDLAGCNARRPGSGALRQRAAARPLDQWGGTGSPRLGPPIACTSCGRCPDMYLMSP